MGSRRGERLFRYIYQKVRGFLIILLFASFHTIANGQQTNDLVIIDPSLPYVDKLIAELKPGARLVYLRKTNDPLHSITKILKHCAPVTSMHLFLEGRPGLLLFADNQIASETLLKSEKHLSQWKEYFIENADVLIYGCEVGKGDAGLDFIRTFAVITGLDIAASDNLTGSEQQGGDWLMEIHSGTIETLPVVNTDMIQNYPVILRREPELKKGRSSI